MNGAELAREVRKATPTLPILVVSGYADVEETAPELPLLTKPFRNAELAASLAALMPQPGSRTGRVRIALGECEYPALPITCKAPQARHAPATPRGPPRQ